MPTLQIGKKVIPYELRRSPSARERRITVTPGHVEVLALADDDDEQLAAFLERKRKWVFNTVREMDRITATRHAVPRFMTGSKIPYRGRKMPLTVRRTDTERISVSYRNGFIVDLPDWAGQDADHLVASELRHWLKKRARQDVREIVGSYGERYGLVPRSIRVADLSNSWGSCGPEGNILVNWQLIFAPRKVLEYVVVHELTHLIERNHGERFWNVLASFLPSYEEARHWLERNEVTIPADLMSAHTKGHDS